MVYCGLIPQTAFIRLANGMTRFIDDRQSISLTAGQLARSIAVRLCSSFFEYIRLLERVLTDHTTIREAKGTENYERRYEVFDEHMGHMKAHESAAPFASKAAPRPSIDRRNALVALGPPGGADLAEEHRRRSEAIDAVTAL